MAKKKEKFTFMCYADDKHVVFAVLEQPAKWRVVGSGTALSTSVNGVQVCSDSEPELGLDLTHHLGHIYLRGRSLAAHYAPTVTFAGSAENALKVVDLVHETLAKFVERGGFTPDYVATAPEGAIVSFEV